MNRLALAALIAALPLSQAGGTLREGAPARLATPEGRGLARALTVLEIGAGLMIAALALHLMRATL